MVWWLLIIFKVYTKTVSYWVAIVTFLLNAIKQTIKFWYRIQVKRWNKNFKTLKWVILCEIHKDPLKRLFSLTLFPLASHLMHVLIYPQWFYNVHKIYPKLLSNFLIRLWIQCIVIQKHMLSPIQFMVQFDFFHFEINLQWNINFRYYF